MMQVSDVRLSAAAPARVQRRASRASAVATQATSRRSEAAFSGLSSTSAHGVALFATPSRAQRRSTVRFAAKVEAKATGPVKVIRIPCPLPWNLCGSSRILGLLSVLRRKCPHFATHKGTHRGVGYTQATKEKLSRRRVVPDAQVIIAGAPASGKGTQVGEHTRGAVLCQASINSCSARYEQYVASLCFSRKRQCEMIVEKYGLAHISAGDLLRAEVAAGTEAGKTAKKFMDNGDLVPDEVGRFLGVYILYMCFPRAARLVPVPVQVVVTMVKNRLAQSDAQTKGWLLDGRAPPRVTHTPVQPPPAGPWSHHLLSLPCPHTRTPVLAPSPAHSQVPAQREPGPRP